MACPTDAALAQFIDGTLPGDASAEIEDHIDRCASCRQTVSATARQGTKQRLAAGTKIGRYELLSPLGAGAMGVVYAAFDPDLDRKIAVKLLATGEQDRLSTRQERLAREARALAKISHPHVVPVHDVGVADGRLFIAMELVDGATLREHVASRSPALRERIELLVQAGRGLAAAHAAGVIHRDFKPDNVFVGRDGRVRVGDFGLAAADLDDAGGEPGDVRVTRTGSLLGTPAYMAPEQLRGEPASAASDQFALCVTAWEILFDARPFTGATPAELADATQLPPREPPRADRRIIAVLLRGLDPDPSRRYRDVASLIDALEQATRPRRTRYLVAGGVALAALAVTGGVLARGTERDPCAHGDGAVREVWTAQARASLVAAFTSSGSPIGRELGDNTAAAIDRWTDRWSGAVRGACRDRVASLVTAEVYAAREQCYRARAGELAALLAVFARPDAKTVERAPSAIAALDLESCTAAARPATVPVERQAEHARARADLARARALRVAGQYREATELLRALPADLSDPALHGEIELELATCANSLGDVRLARDHFSRAVARADAARDDRMRATALIETLELVGDEDAQLEEAKRVEEQARAAVERAGSPPLLVAQLAATIGDVELRRGRYPEAAKSFDRALASYRAQQPVNEFRLADVLNSAAGAHTMLGDHATALRLFGEARTYAERTTSANHPLVAAIWASTVESLYMTGRKDEAFAAARRSIEIYERAFGPRHRKVAQALDNLAILNAMEGKHDAAIADFDRSRAMLESLVGPDHVDVGTSYLNVASANKSAGKLDAAATAYARAIAIWEQALGKQHIDLARPLNGLGKVELLRGAPDKAAALLARALSIREATPGNPNHLADTRFLLAQALAATDRGRAIALAKQAREHYVAEKSDEDVAEIDAWLRAPK